MTVSVNPYYSCRCAFGHIPLAPTYLRATFRLGLVSPIRHHAYCNLRERRTPNHQRLHKDACDTPMVGPNHHEQKSTVVCCYPKVDKRERNRIVRYVTIATNSANRKTASHRSFRNPLRVFYGREWPEADIGNTIGQPVSPSHHFGSRSFSCGRPLSSMSKSGSKIVLPCAPRKAGWALIHKLGFISLA
jgi:hypothetical protein